jgi:hypothetical protein
MNHLCSIACLLARFDEPQPFVDASGDLGEDIGGIGVLQFGRLRAGVACMSKERRDLCSPSSTLQLHSSL